MLLWLLVVVAVVLFVHPALTFQSRSLFLSPPGPPPEVADTRSGFALVACLLLLLHDEPDRGWQHLKHPTARRQGVEAIAQGSYPRGWVRGPIRFVRWILLPLLCLPRRGR